MSPLAKSKLNTVGPRIRDQGPQRLATAGVTTAAKPTTAHRSPIARVYSKFPHY